MAYGNMGNPGEAGGSVGDWGGGEGDVSDWTTVARAMREAMYGPRALQGHSPANVGYGPPQGWGAYAQEGPNSWGNVDAMTNAYGPGSPMDPMSGGMGNRTGAGWSQGLGQSAFNPNYSGKGSNPMGYGPNFFGTPSFNFDEEMEYGGGR